LNQDALRRGWIQSAGGSQLHGVSQVIFGSKGEVVVASQAHELTIVISPAPEKKESGFVKHILSLTLSISSKD
jgi:hypothetical protein